LDVYGDKVFGGFPLSYDDLFQVGSLYCSSEDTSLLHSICGIGGLGYLLISLANILY
jgi:hypothetical protein